MPPTQTIPYYTQVVNILSHSPPGNLISFEELMDNFYDHKQVYVIEALKKGIRLGTIAQVLNKENKKQRYVGHFYTLNTLITDKN